ncbi:hypothetical protein Tco_0377419 [Tanacetum coccineum]
MTVPRNSTVLRAAIVVDPAEPTQRFRPDCRKWARSFCISMRSSTAPTIPSSQPAASIRKAAQRKLEGLLRKAARADKGGKTKDLFWSPPEPRGACGRVRALLRPYESSDRKDFLNGVKELGVADLFLKDGDESMSVDGVKTLPDVEFQKPTRGVSTPLEWTRKKGFLKATLQVPDPGVNFLGVFIERGKSRVASRLTDFSESEEDLSSDHLEHEGAALDVRSIAKERRKGPCSFSPCSLDVLLAGGAIYQKNKRISLLL